MAEYPEVFVDLHLSDAMVDLIGQGFDMALRISALPDTSLMARRLRPIKRHLVGAPAYFARQGTPRHPSQLVDHCCLAYAYLASPETWRFTHPSGEEASIRIEGPMRSNNATALLQRHHRILQGAAQSADAWWIGGADLNAKAAGHLVLIQRWGKKAILIKACLRDDQGAALKAGILGIGVPITERMVTEHLAVLVGFGCRQFGFLAPDQQENGAGSGEKCMGAVVNLLPAKIP
jgi:DNA-binding transcriptional LysR family regulator